ncbi:MAG: hypothetical protein MRZ99_06820 [Clostridiales bacterium]|nr:hypothetical protein [Clostridiales bacterium]
MRSATSFFDKTTARSDLRRHWPIAFIYTCVWLVGLPVNLWSSSMWMPEEMTPALRAAQIIIGSYPTLAGALFVFGCVLAMALMGYLMSPRAVGLLHALPVRRGTLLATHTLVGWLMLNAPALLAVLVSIPVQAYYGGVAWGALGAWLLVHCGLSLFFLALGLLCAMVTGWLLAIPAIYAVVNFAVIAAAGLVRTLCGLFCYGYAGDDDFAPFVYWLTPVVNLVKRFGTCGVERSDAAPYPWQVQFPADVVHAVGIYTAAGAALLALTYLLYRRRKSESAADPAAFPWMRPVFRYGTGLLGGLALGLGLYQLVLGWRMESETGRWVGLLVSTVLMGALCYYAAEMLVRKSLRVLRRSLPGAGLVCVLLALVCAGARFDVPGYAARVPDVSAVTQVQLRGSLGLSAVNCTEPETIETVIALHREIITLRPDEDDPENSAYITLRYTLTDGSTLTRAYQLNPAGELEDALETVFNTGEVREKSLITSRHTGSWRGGYLSLDGTGDAMQLTAAQAGEIYGALLRDIAQGHNHYDFSRLDNRHVLVVQLDLEGSDDYSLCIGELPEDCTETMQALVDVGAAESMDALRAKLTPLYKPDTYMDAAVGY